MENSGYGSAHMPSPALVVFSQAGGLGEALRIQRPFHSQVNNNNHSNNNGNHNSSPQAALTEPHLAYLQRAMSFQLPDAKDLHHLSLVGSYGAHLLHGFPPHFLHPAVSSANSGAFGGGGAFVKPFSSGLPLPSAFAPPKCVGLGLEQGMMFGSGSDSFRTTDSSSPACNSLSPPVKEESLEGHTSEEGDRDRICSPAERSPDVPGFRPFPSKQHLAQQHQQQQQQQHPPQQPPTTTTHSIHQQHQIATGQQHHQQQQQLPPNTNGLEPLNLRLDNGSLHHHHHHNYYANNNNNQLNNNNNNIINNNNNNINNNKYHLSNLFAKRYQQLQQGVGAIKKPQVGTPPPNSCPVCGIQLTINDLEAHFLAELDRLYKLSSVAERHKIRASLSLSGALHPVQPSGIPGPDSRWETFQRIRTNRQSRLRAKTRKRKSESESEFAAQIGNSHCQSCPVCQGRLQRSSEEMAQHVEECLRKSGQSMMQDEDETVDVESYTDDTSNNSAMNMTSHHILTNNINNNTNNNNNNNINNNGNAILAPTPIITNVTKMDTSPSPLASLQRAAEESTITSLHSTAPWDRKQHHPRIGVSSLNCTATALTAATSISRVTPTSSDQRIDVDFDQDHDNDNHQDADNDNDEEVIVDNTDDEECIKRIRPIEKHDKNNTEEATSSVEIDSATDPSNVKPAVATPDSYVSTSDTSAEPSSRAQVLEELRARIRELEGSPFKGNRNGQDEEHYKCYICKEAYRSPVISTICWHVHCDDCWINLSETKKSCPQCKLVTTTSDLRKIHV